MKWYLYIGINVQPLVQPGGPPGSSASGTARELPSQVTQVSLRISHRFLLDFSDVTRQHHERTSATHVTPEMVNTTRISAPVSADQNYYLQGYPSSWLLLGKKNVIRTSRSIAV